MSATQANIVLFRNERRVFSGQAVDEVGNPINIASAVFESDAKSQAGDATVIASAAFTKTDSPSGLFTFEWDGSDFASYGSLFVECLISYDLKVDDDVILYGQIILKPGVS